MIRKEHKVKIADSITEGLTFEDVKKIMKSFEIDVVGITATTSMIPDAYKTARMAKEMNENAKVILDGPHSTFLPEKTMEECKSIDFIVRGEGEYTFKELIDAIEKGKKPENINGLSFRGNKIQHNPPRELIKNVDELPIPSYDLLPMDRYKSDSIKYGTIMTSRGCPFNCIFFSSSTNLTLF